MSVAQTPLQGAVTAAFEYVSTDKLVYDLPWVHVTPEDPDSLPVWRVVVRSSPNADVIVPPFDLTPELHRELSHCLLDAFDYNSLRQLVRFSMDVDLDTLVNPSQNLTVTVEALIDWSVRVERTTELVAAAHNTNPTNRRLAAFVDRIRFENLATLDITPLRDDLALRAKTATRWEAHIERVAIAIREPIAPMATAAGDTPADAAIGLYDFVARSLQQPLVVETMVDDTVLARTTVQWHGVQETEWFARSLTREWADAHMQAVDAAGRTALAVVQRECVLAAAVRRIEQDGVDGRSAWQLVQQNTPPPPQPVLPPVTIDAVRDLPALSVRQPYAEALLSGLQTVHFRRQKTDRRGRILLYAPKAMEPAAAFAALGIDPDNVPTGVVIGFVDLVDCTEMPDGGWAWQLAQPRRLVTPIAPQRKPQPVWFYPFDHPEELKDTPEFEWQHVPKGSFPMGDPISATDAGSSSADTPGELSSYEGGIVPIAEFYMARTPVTNAQFKLFIDAGGYDEALWWTEDGWKTRQKESWTQPRYWDNERFNGALQPVVGVSWYEATAFCNWAAAVTGEPIRLPTEAEWEKAARGTDGRTYPWGEEAPTKKLCNFNRNVGQTTPVDQYSPQGDSPYGCVDMAGNVWEWCASRYAAYPYSADDGRNEPAGTDPRMVRGGSWLDISLIVRCACRDWISPHFWYNGVGFRCASTAF